MEVAKLIKELKKFKGNEQVIIETTEQPFAGAKVEYHNYDINELETENGKVLINLNYLGRNTEK